MPEIKPTRRAVIRTAAWTVPAVTVATAAPAFAASTPPDPTKPNLSTSTSAGATRAANVVTIAPATLRNTGTVAAEGLVIVFKTSVVVTKLMIGPLDPSMLGASVSGLNTTTVTLSVPASVTTIAPLSGVYTSPFAQVLTFATNDLSQLNVTVTAANGGTPFVSTNPSI